MTKEFGKYRENIYIYRERERETEREKRGKEK